MATTTNYGWTTPDDTALVKDGAAAIRTLGSSVDTTTKALNPSTTLGDIEYRSSTANTNTRLGIGSTGDVLTVAGGVPTWAAPAGGGQIFTLLNSGGTSLTGTDVIISGISNIDTLHVLIYNASSTNASATFSFKLNSSSTHEQARGFVSADASMGASSVGSGSGNDSGGFVFSRMSTNAGSIVSGSATFMGCKGTGIKTYQFGSGASQAGGDSQRLHTGGGATDSLSTITSITFRTNTGTFDNGTIYVYGA